MDKDTVQIVDLNEFLMPWRERTLVLLESWGASKKYVPTGKTGSLLSKAAAHILKSLNQERLSVTEKIRLRREADWMIDTLAGIRSAPDQATGLGAARLPEDFWSTPAGRILVATYRKTIDGDWLYPPDAARRQNTKVHNIYRLMYAAKLPSYPDQQGATFRRARRVRMDHVALLLSPTT